ncbi:MAG: hypothetical protein M1338_00500, partial [Patescibacteria group bacterium]|nr:hypothetical protein [Patescibacteria group bacterium]
FLLKQTACQQYLKFIANIWQETQSRNLGFQKETIQICKSKKSGKPFASIKMLAAINKEAVSALINQIETVSVPEKFWSFHKELKAAMSDSLVYYGETIGICGDPVNATFGTLMSTAQSAKDKFISCAENYGFDLSPKIPKDLFLTPGDKLSFVVRQYNRRPQLASIPTANRLLPTGQSSSYLSSMQSIIDLYGRSRDVFQKICDWVRNGTSEDKVSTFRSQLDDCLDIRIRLKKAAERLYPDIGFESSHREILNILDEAIWATQCARNFIDHPTIDGDNWRKFQAISADISHRMPAVARAYGVRW